MSKCLTCIVALLLAAAIARAETVLYNGALNTAPSSQGWAYITSGIDPVQFASGGKTRLTTTTTRTDQAGYFSTFHPSVGVLSRVTGFDLRFDLQLLNEIHDANDRNGDTLDDRGGYSVTAITSDLLGIELSFWNNQVWAYDYQNTGGGFDFVHAESSIGFDPTAAKRRYDLQIHGNNYNLLADGATILSGALRNYSAAGLVYDNPNFLFLGDDTTKAGSQSDLYFISLNPIPEPSTIAMLALGSLTMIRRQSGGSAVLTNRR